ncbi:PHD zinc finger domain-containing protein [Giardia muris]|uniref:PHD zinc finger domain-containing protein n=1 Tax=Giardia muris TaxID=5742 RepID=A0A4Z1SP05_GIAMU|nr:PHD zinc finger domain-containing protein [Giardia muris]|eukprot:TNJ27526.1 PHD zinc finger domain-containing protein [Giardia muris]
MAKSSPAEPELKREPWRTASEAYRLEQRLRAVQRAFLQKAEPRDPADLAPAAWGSGDAAQAPDSDTCFICAQSKCPKVDGGGDWVQCDVCNVWLHTQCDGIFNIDLIKSLTYTCPCCRARVCRPHPGESCRELLQSPYPINSAESSGQRARPPQKRRGGTKRGSAAKRMNTDTETSADGGGVPPIRAETHETKATVYRKLDYFSFPYPVQESVAKASRDASSRRQRSNKETATNPQALESYVNASFNSLRLTPSNMLTRIQNSCLDARLDDPDLPSLPISCVLSTESDDVINPSNFASLFLYCYVSFSYETLPNSAHVADMISNTLEQTLPSRQLVHCPLLPVLPIDYDLRMRVAEEVYDSLLLSLERQRFRYVAFLLPVALHCLLAFPQPNVSLSLAPAPSFPTATIPFSTLYGEVRQRAIDQAISEAVVRIQEQDYMVLAETYKYLPWQRLLNPDVEKTINQDDVPAFLTKRQWHDLRERGVRDFPNLGLIRGALLHALVNASLGFNCLERSLGTSLTNHIISLGVEGGREILRISATQSSVDAALEAGCLYASERYESPMDINEVLDFLKADQPFQNWDVLETPTSVLWALIFLGNEMERLSTNSVNYGTTE